MKLSGKKAAAWQAFSATYLAFYTPYLVWLSLTHSVFAPADLFSPNLLAPTLIALTLVLIHAWVGLRDIMIDYMPRTSLNWLLPSLLVFLLAVGLNLAVLLFIGLSG